jgi:hypothetical protein
MFENRGSCWTRWGFVIFGGCWTGFLDGRWFLGRSLWGGFTLGYWGAGGCWRFFVGGSAVQKLGLFSEKMGAEMGCFWSILPLMAGLRAKCLLYLLGYGLMRGKDRFF